jgi:molybdopterin converting factor small subunit
MKMNRMEEESFPFCEGLTVGRVWGDLQKTADARAPLASLQRDAVLALVNGAPIQRLAGWDTPLAAGDTVTFMVKAFGG